MYNGVILHESFRLPRITTAAGANSGARSILCGAQAAISAYGRGHGPGKYSWKEKLFDYDNQLGVKAEFLAQRDLRLSTAIAALEALVEHGHPVIGKLGLTEEQCADLAIDRDLILDGFAGDIRCEIIGADTVIAVVSDEIQIP